MRKSIGMSEIPLGGMAAIFSKNVWVGDKTAEERARSRGSRPRGLMSIFGFELFFGCKRIQRGGRESHLMVISNRFGGKEALAIYQKRWGIERLFGHLKKNGSFLGRDFQMK